MRPTLQMPVGMGCEDYTAKIVELETRCTHYVDSEGRLLGVLEHLRRKLQCFLADNRSNVDAAERELGRLREELSASVWSCECLSGRMRAQDAEAEDWQRQALHLEGRCAALACSWREEEARSAECAISSRSDHDRVEHVQHEVALRRREIELLRCEASAATAGTRELERDAAALRLEVGHRKEALAVAAASMAVMAAPPAVAAAVVASPHVYGRPDHVLAADAGRIRDQSALLRRRDELELLLRPHAAQRRTCKAWASWRLRVERRQAWRRLLDQTQTRSQRDSFCLWAARAMAQRSKAADAPAADRFARGAELTLLRRCALRRWAVAARAAGLEARRSTLARSVVWWRLVVDARARGCPRAATLLSRRLLRRSFVRWLQGTDRRRQLRSRSAAHWRQLAFDYGFRALAEALAAGRLRRRSKSVSHRCAGRLFGSAGRRAFLAWAAHTTGEQQLCAAAAAARKRWEHHCRHHFLLMGMAAFRGHTAWKASTRSFQTRVFLRSMEQFLCDYLLPRWRAIARRPRLLQKRRSAASRGLLLHAAEAWRATILRCQRLCAVGGCAAARGAERHRRAAWASWREGVRTRWRRQVRERLVEIRRAASACHDVMAAWRSVLRARARARRDALRQHLIAASSLDDSCSFERGEIGKAGPSVVAAPGPLPAPQPAREAADLRWLALADELQREAHAAAESSVALDDARSRSSALAAALEDQNCEAQALREQVGVLESEAREASEHTAASTATLEEELRDALARQAGLRATMRRTVERRLCNEEAAACARRRCVDLEGLLDHSSRICSELVDDRGQRIAELDAWSMHHRGQVARLEEALEEEQTVERVQEIELRRRQRQCSLLVDSGEEPRRAQRGELPGRGWALLAESEDRVPPTTPPPPPPCIEVSLDLQQAGLGTDCTSVCFTARCTSMAPSGGGDGVAPVEDPQPPPRGAQLPRAAAAAAGG